MLLSLVQVPQLVVTLSTRSSRLGACRDVIEGQLNITNSDSDKGMVFGRSLDG